MNVAIFDDRLEIWNEGLLPFGQRPEDLKQLHPSRPRNPLIAGVFFRRGLIEAWGRGTQKIVELCVQAGLPEPDFGQQVGSTWVRFWRGVESAVQVEWPELSERQAEILGVLSATAAEMPFSAIRAALSTRASERTVRNDLTALRKAGLVSLEGHGRGARWVLVAVGERGNE